MLFRSIIGVNTAIFSPSGASAGIGFAIPINIVKLIANDIIEKGSSTRMVLGIVHFPTKKSKHFGLGKGVIIADVRSKKALKAGLLPMRQDRYGNIQYDKIVKMDKKEIKEEEDYFRALYKKTEGDSIQLKIRRMVLSPEGEIHLVREIDMDIELTPQKIWK